MQVAKVAGLCLATLATMAIAADAPFTLALTGGGRACSGGLFVRTKTIEWNASFSRCKPSPYEILGRETAGDHERLAFRLLNRNRSCRYAVIEAEQVRPGSWNVNGYPSLEAYQKRDIPDWREAPLPARQVLSCPMYEGG